MSREKCGGVDDKVQINRLLVRAASNAYFAQTLSAISIPEPGAALRLMVENLWATFRRLLCQIRSSTFFSFSIQSK